MRNSKSLFKSVLFIMPLLVISAARSEGSVNLSVLGSTYNAPEAETAFSLEAILQTQKFNEFYLKHTQGEAPLLHVTSDALPGFVDLKVFVDADFNVVSVRVYSDKGLNGEYFPKDLSAGVVLAKDSGYDVAKVVSRDFDPHSGGEIDFVYLSSALSKEYGTFKMNLVRTGNTWALQTNDQSGHREFHSMFLKKRTFFGKTIGIQQVTVQ